MIAQLYHAYRELNGGDYPESALIKAIVMNTVLLQLEPNLRVLGYPDGVLRRFAVLIEQKFHHGCQQRRFRNQLEVMQLECAADH